ncbi:hypothetical protein UlMin_039772 [Ulmus minor]
MASQNPSYRNSMYPEVVQSNPEATSLRNLDQNPSSSSPNLYPSIDTRELVENLFPDDAISGEPLAPPVAIEEVILRIPGAILNLIDKHYSVELAWENVVAVLARVAEEIQWPLARDEAAVKLDDSHYFFSLVKELDGILQSYSSFTVQKVAEKAKQGEALDGSVAMETSPADLKSEKKRELMEERSAAYWITLAPNMEDYIGTAAKMIAAGSGQLIKGILWCGDVTVDRLKWGNEVMKKRMSPGSEKEVSKETLKRIRRVKRVSKMTEKVANGVISGVVKVSGFFTSSVANSKAGKKFFGLLPGEIVLASLDGFSKVCDAVEVSGKNVMSTSSTVTTELVNHRQSNKKDNLVKRCRKTLLLSLFRRVKRPIK